MKPSISVIIPTHNRPQGLKDSLESIRTQSLLPNEIIVVDDGSTPPVSKNIFDGFTNKTQCTLIRNETPQGGNNARNKGILAAKSDYIALLDDDDKFKPNKIEILSKEISNNPSYDIFYHAAQIHMLNEKVSYFTKPHRFMDNEDVFSVLLVKNVIGGTPMITARKKSLLDVGLFDEKMPALQDFELWLRLAKNRKKFHLIEEVLTDCYYTTKQGSISKSIDNNKKAILYIEKKYQSEYQKLSTSDIKEHEIWKKKMIIHKSLLNENKKTALKTQISLFCLHPSLINLASIFVIPLGSTFVFKLKARFL